MFTSPKRLTHDFPQKFQSSSASHFLKLSKKNLSIVICLPMVHYGVHKNSLKRVRAFQIELEFESVGF